MKTTHDTIGWLKKWMEENWDEALILVLSAIIIIGAGIAGVVV